MNNIINEFILEVAKLPNRSITISLELEDNNKGINIQVSPDISRIMTALTELTPLNTNTIEHLNNLVENLLDCIVETNGNEDKFISTLKDNKLGNDLWNALVKSRL